MATFFTFNGDWSGMESHPLATNRKPYYIEMKEATQINRLTNTNRHLSIPAPSNARRKSTAHQLEANVAREANHLAIAAHPGQAIE